MGTRGNHELGLIYMVSNVGITAAIFFLPLLLEDRGITDAEIGWLALPYSVSLFVANSYFGRLTDSHGRKPFLLVGLLTSAFSTIFYIFPEQFLIFTIARVLNGISLGMFPAALVALASDRQVPMGELSAWRALGWTIGAIINGLIADLLQLDAVFVLGGLFFIIAFGIALLQSEVEFDFTGIVTPQAVPKYSLVIKKNWHIYLIVILRHGSGSSIWIYWTLFLQNDLNLSTSQIGVVLAINTITQTVIMRFFTDRGNSRVMFLSGTLISAIAFVSFPLSRSFLEICLTQIILGLSFAFFLVGGLRTVEQGGADLKMVGTAVGLFEASFSISQIVGPIIAIIIFAQFHTYTSLMYNAAGITFLASVLYGFLMKR